MNIRYRTNSYCFGRYTLIGSPTAAGHYLAVDCLSEFARDSCCVTIADSCFSILFERKFVVSYFFKVL